MDEEITLSVPDRIPSSLPTDDDDAPADMRKAVSGLERTLNESIVDCSAESEAADCVLDAVDRLDSRRERYDEFVPELRAWGQSPIYAIAWRNLYAALIDQLYRHEWFVDALDDEHDSPRVGDGIRFTRDG